MAAITRVVSGLYGGGRAGSFAGRAEVVAEEHQVELPPITPAITPAGGIVKYRDYEEENNRIALMQYQRKRREQQIEDEDILAVIIVIARSLH